MGAVYVLARNVANKNSYESEAAFLSKQTPKQESYI